MQSAIAVDFETFYKKKEYSVRDLGNWRYCHDERFDPYLVSVYDGGDSWCGKPTDFNWDALDGELCIANNAGFERNVCKGLVDQGKIPAINPSWQCVANMTSYLASVRSMEEAVNILYGQRLDKGPRDFMNGKTWAEAVALGKSNEIAKYCQQDTKWTHKLWTDFGHMWPQRERELSELTMMQCARGVHINVDLLDEYRAKLQLVIFNLVQSFPWTARGAKPTSPIAIAEECRNVGIPAPPVKEHDEEGFILWLKTYGPVYPWARGAGNWRQLNKLLTSLDTIRERLRPDGTIDFSLLYFGAHTGRWSGGGSGLNLQNLRKVPIFLKDNCLVEPPPNLSYKAFQDWIAACTDYALDVRKMFVPRPGKKFILCDLSQIEPRVLAWLTKNRQLLDMLRTGMSIYEAFARLAMGWTGGELKKEDASKYQLSKIQVLGLGFGCGWEKFIDIAAEYFVYLTPEQSQQIVTDFRMTNPLITEFWDTLGAGLQRSRNSNYEVTLPSGRDITYRKVARQVRQKLNRETGKMEARTVWTGMVGSKRKDLYGGIICENVVQATARDVFAGQLLALEEQISDVIFHVHDESINEVDLDVKPKDIEEVMSVCPEWLEGCPLGAEAKEANHYLK